MSNVKPVIEIGRRQIPRFIYGTAWKKRDTERLVYQAAKAGFRAFDTANQRKHYFEAGVGKGLWRYIEETGARREDFFIQTKFTYAFAQDHRKPYDPRSPVQVQLEDSFASSLKNLKTDYIDSYLLHGLSGAEQLDKNDVAVWRAMERLKDNNLVRFLGVSNVPPKGLRELCKISRHLPDFVQNRSFASLGWDHEVRRICRKHGIHYQGFSLLTANDHELSFPIFKSLQAKYQKSTAQIVFRFCQQMDMLTLTGTTNTRHMHEDLDIYDFQLSRSELKAIETCAI